MQGAWSGRTACKQVAVVRWVVPWSNAKAPWVQLPNTAQSRRRLAGQGGYMRAREKSTRFFLVVAAGGKKTFRTLDPGIRAMGAGKPVEFAWPRPEDHDERIEGTQASLRILRHNVMFLAMTQQVHLPPARSWRAAAGRAAARPCRWHKGAPCHRPSELYKPLGGEMTKDSWATHAAPSAKWDPKSWSC